MVFFYLKLLRVFGLCHATQLLGSKFVCANEHRAPQNLKNFVGDTSEVQATTNLRTDIKCRAKSIPRSQQNKKTPAVIIATKRSEDGCRYFLLFLYFYTFNKFLRQQRQIGSKNFLLPEYRYIAFLLYLYFPLRVLHRLRHEQLFLVLYQKFHHQP